MSAASQQNVGMRQVFERVVKDRDLHAATLNLYYYSEYRGAQGIARLAEKLHATQPVLAEHLVHHADDEFRHAEMIGGMMADLGATPTPPLGLQYVDEFAELATALGPSEELDEVFITAGINVTEKRGLFSFALHVAALPDGSSAHRTLNQIKNEEAGHVRWGNDALKRFQQRGDSRRVAQARSFFERVEETAYETSLDIMPGAPLRRMKRLWEVAAELPEERRLTFLTEQFARALDPRPLMESRWRVVSTIFSSPRLRDQVSDDVVRLLNGQRLGEDSILKRLGDDAVKAVKSLFDRPAAA